MELQIYFSGLELQIYLSGLELQIYRSGLGLQIYLSGMELQIYLSGMGLQIYLGGLFEPQSGFYDMICDEFFSILTLYDTMAYYHAYVEDEGLCFDGMTNKKERDNRIQTKQVHSIGEV